MRADVCVCVQPTCLPGYSCTNGALTACPMGSYGYNGSCTGCPKGWYSGGTAAACSPSPAGYYTDGTMLHPCDAGSYSSAASTGCVTCPLGTYTGLYAANDDTTANNEQLSVGNAACITCSAGYACPGPTVTTNYLCSAHSWSAAGSGTCNKCEDGRDCSRPYAPVRGPAFFPPFPFPIHFSLSPCASFLPFFSLCFLIFPLLIPFHICRHRVPHPPLCAGVLFPRILLPLRSPHPLPRWHILFHQRRGNC